MVDINSWVRQEKGSEKGSKSGQEKGSKLHFSVKEFNLCEGLGANLKNKRALEIRHWY
jgi:hypothetical protein